MAGKGPGYLQSRAALRDGALRAGTHFDAEVSAEPAADLGAELMAWAQNHQLKRVVAYRPFVRVATRDRLFILEPTSQ